MKNFFILVITVLLCVGVQASDGSDVNPGVDALPLPAAPETFEVGATSMTVSWTSWNQLLNHLQPMVLDTEHGLTGFRGNSAVIRSWIDRMLQGHQTILTFDTRGRTSAGQPWRFASAHSAIRSVRSTINDSGEATPHMADVPMVGPGLEVLPASDDDSLLVNVSYSPSTLSQGPPDGESRDILRTGDLALSHEQTLVLLTDDDVARPVSLLAISVAQADEPATLEHDVQFFPSGPEAANRTPTSEQDAPPPAEVDESPPQTRPTSDDVRFYPMIGPARLTSSGELVREDGAVVAAVESHEPDVSTAGRYIDLTAGEPQTIEMHEFEARRVSLEKRIKSASGFNPTVIEVTASGANELQIRSSGSGATRLTIIDEDDEALELTVIVTRDVTDLELLLERLYPNTTVEVVPIQNTVLLRGTVGDPEEVHQIEEIAEQFAPQVLNQLRVGDASVSTTIPSGYRVLTVNADCDVDILEPGEFVDVVVSYQEYDEAGEPVRTYSERLLRGVEVFSVKTRTIGVGGAQSVQMDVTALLLRPDEAQALSFVQDHFQSRCVQLEWRASPEVGAESRLDQEVLSQLKQKAGQGATGDAAGYPATSPGGTAGYAATVPAGSPYPGATTSTPVGYRVVSIGIGTNPANLGFAEPGDLVDLLASDPGLESPETIAAGVRLVGVVEPKDDVGRFVWLVVPPEVGKEVDARTVASGVSFALQPAANAAPADPYGAPAPGTPVVSPYANPPGAPTPGTPAPAVNPYGSPPGAPAAGSPYASQPGAPAAGASGNPGTDSDADLNALRDDIRALHEDVRRLIEVLEERQQDEPDADASTDLSAIDEAATVLFFDASWCGPCRRIRPIVSRLQDDGFAIRIIDIDKQREVARRHDVKSIPCFLFLYDGREVERLIGATTENELRSRLARAWSPENRTETASLGRAWTELGLRLEETPSDLGNAPYRGALHVTGVRAGSPADSAGLRAGDLLVGLHVWETISLKNVEYVLHHPSWNTFAPLKFYALRNGQTLFGHFPHGDRTSLDYPRQINGTGDEGPLPIAATAVEAVDLLPLPAAPVDPADTHVPGLESESERVPDAGGADDGSASQMPDRVWKELGMRIETVAADDEQVAGSRYRGAVRISEVREDSPADDARLRAGDLLVGLHVWETVSPENVDFVLNHASLNTSEPLRFYVLRDGETLSGHFPPRWNSGIEISLPVGYRGTARFVQLPARPLAQAEDEADAAVDLLPLPGGGVAPADVAPHVSPAE